MTPTELKNMLDELMALPAEVEWFEFKEARSNFHFNNLGKYFSALGNEANLKGRECGWLVFGVRDNPREIVGSNYRPDRPALDRLKKEISGHTTNGLTFDEIYELDTSRGRVVMFRIPSALRGMPTAWKGHYYGRDGESLGPLNLREIEQIRGQGIREDWSIKFCEGATLNDLDTDAIAFAREQYKEKQPGLADEADKWNEPTFLNKAKVCINGRITRAAMLLLGKAESEYFLAPAIGRITWVLKDNHGIEKAYEHFGPPLILAVARVFSQIRNLIYRYIPNAGLFPTEVKQYDPWVVREILHNCIAHQDYGHGGRINVVEEPETLLFTNLGHFIPGAVETVIRSNAPPEVYRNRFLAEAMVNLNMIDTIGSGIRRMFEKQRRRFFPMPDYNLEDPERVQVRLFGKVLDEKFTRLLIENAELDLMDVMALDKVQKKQPLTDEEFMRVKKHKLVEGRRTNLFVSAKIATLTENKATYIKHRAFDKTHYKNLILAYLKAFGEAGRQDIDRLLIDKLSDALTEAQKKSFVKNLLQEMRKDCMIEIKGSTRWARWSIP